MDACIFTSLGIAAIAIIASLRIATRTAARVDALDRQLFELKLLLRRNATTESERPVVPEETRTESTAAEATVPVGSGSFDAPAPRATQATPLSESIAAESQTAGIGIEPGRTRPYDLDTGTKAETLGRVMAGSGAAQRVSLGQRSVVEEAAGSVEGFERHFTTRIAIWLGAIALFLAGAFFVKYTFDAGLLGPAVRISLGAVFGAALVGAGEWMRRRGDARIGEGLTAAGVADLYAVTLAALNLYQFVGATAGFALLAAITAAAIGLSIRQGPFVALLGLVGGFATPALIGSDDPRPGPLFVYLLLLQGGIAGVARARGWWPLGLLAFMGGIAWVSIWLFTSRGSIDGAWLAGFVLLSLPLVLGTIGDPCVVGPTRARGLGLIAGVVSMLALGAVVNVSGFTATDWGFLAVLGIGAIAAARFDARHEPLPWLSLALTAVLLVVWAVRTQDVDATIFAWVSLGMAVLYGGGAYAALWGSKWPGRFSALSCAGGLAAFLIAYGALSAPPNGVAWGLIAVLAAVSYVVAAIPLARPNLRSRLGDEPLAAMLAAATAFVSLAVAVEFERRLIPVAWAIEAPLLALLFARLRVELLRVLSAGLAALAILGLVLPDIFNVEIGPTPIWNWLLYAYGLPAITMALSAWIYYRLRDPTLVIPFQAGAALLVFLLVTLETRHFFHNDALFSGQGSLSEAASFVAVWLAASLAAVACARGAAREVAETTAKILAVLSLVAAGGGMLLAENPLWTKIAVGETLIVNDLLWTFGVPAALFFVLAYAIRGWEPPEFAAMVGIGGVVLLFALISLEVRHVFDREIVLHQTPKLAEIASYVTAWLLLALIGLGVARGVARAIAGGAARFLAVLSLVFAAGGLLLAQNPLWNSVSVGETRVWNLLLPCYGVPAALMVALAFLMRRWEPRELGGALVLGGIVLGFSLVSLEVRQWFRGDLLTGSWPSGAELYAYSAAWTVFGLSLLGVGVAIGSAIARWASLVVMLGVVGKVFLADTAGLRDLYRVFSLLGLGLSLMLLAFVYQRFVFQRTTAKPAA